MKEVGCELVPERQAGWALPNISEQNVRLWQAAAIKASRCTSLLGRTPRWQRGDVEKIWGDI